MFKVYTPNPNFSGFRNVGLKFKGEFKKGVAEVTKSNAEFLCDCFGYFCPELRPEDVEKVKAIRPDFEESKSEESKSETEDKTKAIKTGNTKGRKK